jgi:hypothetical protein
MQACQNMLIHQHLSQVQVSTWSVHTDMVEYTYVRHNNDIVSSYTCLLDQVSTTSTVMWEHVFISICSAAQRENVKSMIPSWTKSTVVIQRGPWSWTNSIIFITITLNADSLWFRPQWTTTFLYNVLYKPTCTKYLDRIKFTLKNQCKCGHFYCMWTW